MCFQPSQTSRRSALTLPCTNTDAPERSASPLPALPAGALADGAQADHRRQARPQSKMTAVAAGRDAQTLGAAHGRGVVRKIQAQASALPLPPATPAAPSNARRYPCTHSRHSILLSDSPPVLSPAHTPPAAGGRPAGRPTALPRRAHREPHAFRAADAAPEHHASPALPPPRAGSRRRRAVQTCRQGGVGHRARHIFEIGLQSGKAMDKSSSSCKVCCTRFPALCMTCHAS